MYFDLLHVIISVFEVVEYDYDVYLLKYFLVLWISSVRLDIMFYKIQNLKNIVQVHNGHNIQL